ncbi:MAG: silent information regulator protein Sir2 [Spirochaetaceae bacterium]
MNDCIELIKKSSKILIFTGAGISTNCGIPDFRSSNGLYSFAKQKYGVPYPEAVFDIDFFDQSPKPFSLLSADLLGKNIKPSASHNFIKKLEDLGKLEIVVTQNIDMLHEKCGNKRVLSCHGTYTTGHCRKCIKEYGYDFFIKYLLLGEVCYCDCGGVVKPDITFFGESLPAEFYQFVENPPVVDLVIVMGTSLEVQPANQVPLMYKGKVPLIIVNRDNTQFDSYFDYKLNMDCDDFSNMVMKEII